MAVSLYIAVEGQSIYDICLNTYGSLDYLLKLIIDSGLDSIDIKPYSGQIFVFDPELVVDQSVNRSLTLGNIRYATAYSKLGSAYYTVKEPGVGGTPGSGNGSVYNPPPDPNIKVTIYQMVGNGDYTAGNPDGELVISLPDFIGKDILWISKEIKNIRPNTEFSWNKNSGTLTLSEALYKDETIFFLWQENITITI